MAFSEAGHEKGAPDGIGDCLKRTADDIVARGKDLSNLDVLVKELREACKGITIFSVDDPSISEIDKYIPHTIAAFKGTLKIHEIVWRSTYPSELFVRRLSCLKCFARCDHYGLGVVKLEMSNKNNNISSFSEIPLYNQRLCVEDIYSSDSDSDIPLSTLKEILTHKFKKSE